ncbi:hypothetical protein JMJ35_002769 [Cladonia borealis]|uniref:ERF1 methyltransferase catalytic subunit MTQ2 n=1 Tax=Cladonia borealis TaxID=184061 RepID=A0AA39R7U3_9LECA|nr:hypothetical protein JMJ35_002769 [Cladonia borealis]
MLPTPSTSHVDPNRIYEPAEDSYLLLDTLSSTNETNFLKHHFGQSGTQSRNAPTPSPIVLEVGTGSGVILAFVTANAEAIFGRPDVLALGTDVNNFACQATKQTVLQTCEGFARDMPSGLRRSPSESTGLLLATLGADLASPIRGGMIDVLIFNPPYVPSAGVPDIKGNTLDSEPAPDDAKSRAESYERDSRLLALSYEGGVDGMEVINRLLEQLPQVLNRDKGVAYILLCQQNRPEETMQRIYNWVGDWYVEVVGRSGNVAGWEKLCIIRIWKG